MKVELQKDGTWLATGNGPLRNIVVGAKTREEAMKGYSQMYRTQDAQIRDYYDDELYYAFRFCDE